MATVRASVTFAWPADVVWPYLVAFEQVPLWEHGVLEVRQLTPGEARVGTEVSARRLYAGKEAVLRGRIVSLVPGREATMELDGGPLQGTRATYAVAPLTDGSSVVTYIGEVGLRGPTRLLAPVVPFLGRRETRKNLRRLQRRIAAGIPPTSDEPTPD